jgi:hypothetical protein
VTEVRELSVGGTVVARYVLPVGLPASLSPRPYLHPVTTLNGTVVTAVRPPDHEWHLGAGLALPDVGGVNFWGGPTYVRSLGYRQQADHGFVEHLRWRSPRPDALVSALRWVGGDGAERLSEERAIAATAHDTAPDCWVLHVASSLRNTSGVALHIGSPATNGRQGAGYGGFFWRAPRSAAPWRVFSPAGRTEAAVFGARTRWLALGGRSEGADYTLVFVVPGEGAGGPSASRPWFVRTAEYPGVCSAVAFDRAVVLLPDARLDVRLSVLVADGALDVDTVSHLARDLPESAPLIPPDHRQR